MTPQKNYYKKHARRFLKEFDLVVHSARPVLQRYFKGEDLDVMMVQTRQDFETLLPGLPYIGGRQPFTLFLVFTAMVLALHHTNLRRGGNVELTGELVYEIGRAFLSTSSNFLLRILKRLNFSRYYLRRLQAHAQSSHLRIYPGDYVLNFIPSDGKNFDYGVDYLECASYKYLASQGVPELTSAICPVDILYSQFFDWGLVRTQTLATGGNRCDFRFKQGGETRVAIPCFMQEVVERNRLKGRS